MTQKTYIKINGVWKAVRIIWEKVAGSWKYLVVSKINVDGTWKTCMSYTPLPGATPIIQGGSYTATKPSGFTACYPRINTSSATPAKCSYLTSIAMTQGSSAYSFYLKAQGMYGVNEQILDAVADVRLSMYHPVYGTIENVIAAGVSLLKTGGVQIAGNLASFDWGIHGTNWLYDDVGTITIENITWGAYASCS